MNCKIKPSDLLSYVNELDSIILESILVSGQLKKKNCEHEIEVSYMEECQAIYYKAKPVFRLTFGNKAATDRF